MRLIDADALMNLYAENEFSSDMGDAMEMLDHFPTVDAVPIKWIENYLKNYRYMAPIEKTFVRKMIKAWAERKEE